MKCFVGVLLCFLFIIEDSKSTVLVADYGMSKMIELTSREPYCTVHTDRGRIRSMLLSSDPRRVRQMSDESIENLENVCKSNVVKSGYQGGFIYPGTKWCGPGDIAKNYNDLGYHSKEDMCCREHDNCPKSLLKGECKQGICNKSPFTRSHCDCDATFRRCLQNANTETANTIGAIFFNVIQVICFKERSPCSQWQNKTVSDNSVFSDLADTCDFQFVPSNKYVAPKVPFSWRTSKEFLFNLLLRKLRIL